MGVLGPGRAGRLVAIMMEVVRGPVCVGREPVITLPPSVEASSAMGSVLRSPTAQGKQRGDAALHLLYLL